MTGEAGRGSPHVVCSTTGDTPFRLHLAVGDVGHTLILGPTGAGKSTLLGTLALQWLRYPNARVIVFDKDRSARAATLAIGGAYYEPGHERAPVIAHYDSMVVWGQQRVLVCWSRLLFPNGRSIDLQCMPAADLQGAAGLADQLDEHWLRLLSGATVASLLAATAQGVAGNQTGLAPTVPQLWANNGAQSINQSGQQIVRRDMTVQPTITVRPGFSVNVIVNRDIVLSRYVD